MLRGKTEAETARLNGWVVGDILEGGECGIVDKIRITAIGVQGMLCVWYDRETGLEASESNTTLSCREWRKIGNDHSCLPNQDMSGTCMACGKERGPEK